MTEENSAVVPFGLGAIDQLMPLFLRVSPSGHITAAGRTIQKLRPGVELVGKRLLELFEIRRPRDLAQFSDLYKLDQSRMRVTFREPACHALKGQYVRLPGDEGAIINLSLGISVVEAVSLYDLSAADFAPCDPTVDMLYLIEAKSVALNASKHLNARLNGQKSEAEQLALSDTLTGLNNRRALDETLADLLEGDTLFAMMHVDLDYFKQVNDSLGHAAGDLVLKFVSEVLRDEIRVGDLAARVGGDEFVLVFRDCVDPAVLNRMASRIISRLEQPVMFDGQPCCISASIGTTLSTFYDPPEIDQMLSDADHALYASKNAGRACHTVFDPIRRGTITSAPQTIP